MVPKIWATQDGFDYVSLSKETLDGGMDVMKNAFFKDEQVAIAVELSKEPGSDEELLPLCLNAAKDGVSIVAIEKSTGKIAGASFNKIIVPDKPGETSFYEKFCSECRFQSSKALVQFMIDADSACNLFDHYSVDCVMELQFMATLPEFRGKGIAKKLFEVSIELAKKLKNGENVKIPIDNRELSLEPTPKVVSGIFTSFVTQNLAKKFGFVKTAEIGMDQFMYKGKTFASRIGPETKSTTLESLKL